MALLTTGSEMGLLIHQMWMVEPIAAWMIQPQGIDPLRAQAGGSRYSLSVKVYLALIVEV